MRIGILASGLALLAIGYILAKLGGDPSDRPEGANYLGVAVDSGTLWLLYLYGPLILFLGILVTIIGAVLKSKKKDKKKE